MAEAVLVLRPEPGAARTAERLQDAGFAPIVYPLFAVEAAPWTPPDPAAFDAVLMTSANAARHGGEDLMRYAHLPLFAVGAETARAAREVGFRSVHVGGGDAAATVPLLVAAGHGAVLHPCGEAVRDYDPCGLSIARRPVYHTVDRGDADGLAATLRDVETAWAMIHSPRAGARLSSLVGTGQRGPIALCAISAAAAAACGSGWRAIAIAEAPTEAAMLAKLQKLV